MAYTQAELSDALANYLAVAPNATYSDIVQAASGLGISPQEVQATIATSPVVIDKITQQILGQGTTDKWSGEGKGSAQANAADMAKMLVSADITDISQFGKVALYEPVQEIGKTYNGQNVSLGYDAKTGTQTYGTYTGALQTDGEGGSYNAFVSVPQNAKLETAYGIVRDGGDMGGYLEPVDTSKLKTVNGKLSADTGGTTFGNILTGKNIANNYETGSNAFGGTYDGKGNTGYRVEFDATGKPLFYTTGASSSDVGKIMPFIQLALAATGAGGLLGNALLGAGASTVASSALGNAIIGGLTTGIAGGDPLKGALLGGAGGALSGYLQGGPIDASGMTSTQFNDALETQLIGELQRNGLTNAQISQWLENASTADITSVVNALPETGASDNLIIEAAKTPITANALTNVLSQTPTIVTTATRPEQVFPDTLNAVTSLLNNNLVTTPTVNVTATRPNNTDIPVITPITTAPITTTTTPTTPTVEITATKPLTPDIPVITPITTMPVVTPTITTPTTTPPVDPLRVAQIGLTVAGLLGAGSVISDGTTQYPIVPVPETFLTPTKPAVAPFTPLTPINFGDGNLLRGTQWEKFLNPNYGKVPEPIKYSQPSSLSYNDLMGILGSRQGMPPSSSLSINDIISGIQNQYGQVPARSMG